MMNISDIDEIKKEKAEVGVLEDKKRQLLNEIKDLEMQHKGKATFLSAKFNI